MSNDVAEAMLQVLLDADVRLVEPDESAVWRTAAELRVSAYDAAYVALAEQAACAFWTDDRPLLRSRRSAPLIRSIAEFSSSV